MQQHASTYSVLTQTLDPWGVGSKGQNSSFSEHGHVAYQIKGNHKCSNMQGHILSLHTPSTPGVESKGQNNFFSESSHIAYQIKGNGAQSTMQAHILSFNTHPRHWGGVKDQNIFFFLKVVMLYISN